MIAPNIPTLENIIKEKIQNTKPFSTPIVPHSVTPKLKKLLHIKAVAFDIYGTLLHSAAGEISIAKKIENKNMYLPHLQLNVDIKTVQKILKQYISIHHQKSKVQFPEVNIVDVWQDIIKNEFIFTSAYKNITPQYDIKTCAQHCALYYELETNTPNPMPHTLDILKTLVDSHIQLGIVSNAQFYTPLILENMFDPSWNTLPFSAQTWSYALLEAKPSQNLYKHLLSQWKQFKAHEILFVGNDVRNDIDPAAQLGIKTCLFAGDTLSYRPRLELPHLHQPDVIVTDLLDIKNVI